MAEGSEFRWVQVVEYLLGHKISGREDKIWANLFLRNAVFGLRPSPDLESNGAACSKQILIGPLTFIAILDAESTSSGHGGSSHADLHLSGFLPPTMRENLPGGSRWRSQDL